MLFPLNDNERYENRMLTPADVPEYPLIWDDDERLVHYIPDGLIPKIRRGYAYIPERVGEKLRDMMKHQGSPGGDYPGGCAFVVSGRSEVVYEEAEGHRWANELADLMVSLCDLDIKAAIFFTDTGEYAPLWITHDSCNDMTWEQARWYRVHRRDEKGRIVAKSSL